MKKKDLKFSLIIVIILSAVANILTFFLGVLQNYVTMERTSLMQTIDQSLCLCGCRSQTSPFLISYCRSVTLPMNTIFSFVVS